MKVDLRDNALAAAAIVVRVYGDRALKRMGGSNPRSVEKRSALLALRIAVNAHRASEGKERIPCS